MPRDFRQRPTVNGVGVALQGEGAGAIAVVVLAADQVNNNAVANTLQDAVGLSFPVQANQTYRFRFTVIFDAAAITTGSRWALNGPAFSILGYTQRVAATVTGANTRYDNAYNVGGLFASSAYTNGNLMIMEGIVRPMADGTVTLRFASEVASSAITVRAGSCVEVW